MNRGHTLVFSFTITGKLNIELAALINSIIYLQCRGRFKKPGENFERSFDELEREKRVNLTMFMVHRHYRYFYGMFKYINVT